MRCAGGFVAALLLLAMPARAGEADWVGSWGAHWSGGDVRIELAQHGNEIVGSIPLHGGQIKGHVEGSSLVGDWSESGWSGKFVFTLTPSGQGFLGRFDNGEWWSGGRLDGSFSMPTIDQSTPRAVVRSFLLAGDRARTAVPDAIGRAAMMLEFGGKANSLTILEQVMLTQNLFNLMDLTTVNLWEVPEAPFEDKITIRLTQSGTGVLLPLQLHRLNGNLWWIVAPDQDAIDVSTKALLARTSGRVPPREADPTLPTARDTMRRFVEAIPNWNNGGRERALSTLDLSQLPEATREYEGALAAQYIVRILERVGPVITQEVPDDPSARNPYVHFIDPAGRIAIARVGEGKDAPWKLTADTVQSARDLYVELAPMPIVKDAAISHPGLLYFRLRQTVARHAPALLGRLHTFNLEYWQLLAGVTIFVGGAILAVIVVLALRLLLRDRVEHAVLYAPGGLKWPICLSVIAIAWSLLTPYLGVPREIIVVTSGVSAIVLSIGAVWAGWQMVGHAMARHGAGPQAPLDEIVSQLLIGLFRAAMVIGAMVYVADALSIPYSGLVAGLGISGLAIAFASKETLSNVFGAGILVIDRPFRRGDLITAGDTKGTVEHVGIRSTRIRTSEDSVLIVPNGKLADATINNMGTRRYRLAQASLMLPFSVLPDRVSKFVEGLRSLLEDNPNIVDDRTQLGVSSLSSSGVQIDLTCYLDVASAAEERVVRQALMLDIFRLGEQMGVPPLGIERKPEEGAAELERDVVDA